MNFEHEIVEVSMDNRNPKVEERYNLHITKPYRVQVVTAVYDGIMTGFRVHLNEKGFLLLSLELKDGLFYDHRIPWEKFPFDKQLLRGGELKRGLGRLLAFGRIMDEEGFQRAKYKTKE
tara:strand:+ start:17984 stop:18340 length:357 start_codon:yes stop_codon:yes gene_type:complete